MNVDITISRFKILQLKLRFWGKRFFLIL